MGGGGERARGSRTWLLVLLLAALARVISPLPSPLSPPPPSQPRPRKPRLIIPRRRSEAVAASTETEDQVVSFGDVLVVGNRHELDATAERPLMALSFERKAPGLSQAAAVWQGLSQWVEAHGMQLSLAVLQEAGDGSAGAPAVWCMGELGQNTAFEGPLELEPLKLFVAQECRGTKLDLSALTELEKYSSQPAHHDAEYSKMIQQLTDRNFPSRTRGRKAVVLVSSGICALCKILRPAYTRLRREAALAKVSVLHMDLDTQKGNAVSSHVLAAPAVLYLHGGAVTSRLAAKPSKDTAAYARHLVTWAVRQTLLPEALVESAAEKMLAQVEESPLTASASENVIESLFPLLKEDSLAALLANEGLMVLYYTASCWQCTGMLATWKRLAEETGGRVARSKMEVFPARSPQALGSHHCTAAFCVLYWRRGGPVARFSGTIDASSLLSFWRAMSSLSKQEAEYMAQRLEQEQSSSARLQQEARVVRELKDKERQQASKHTEL